MDALDKISTLRLAGVLTQTEGASTVLVDGVFTSFGLTPVLSTEADLDALFVSSSVDIQSYEDSVIAAQVAAASQDAAASTITQQFAGRFLLDPNEVNGFGQGGFVDETISRDVGNADAASLSRLGGGFMFPHDVNLKSFKAWHRNSNAAAEAWGWVIAVLSKTPSSNTQVTTYVLHETQENGNAGTRDYLNTQNQLTDIDLSGLPNKAVSAGDVIFIGVASPTANATNYYVEVMAGYIESERI